MPDFNVIANVSQTLVSVLTQSLQAVDPLSTGDAPIAILHNLTEEPTTPRPVLTVFLFEVVEDPSARNRRRVREPISGNGTEVRVSKPPMALLLRYLLTPWSRGGENDQASRLLEHRMIGRVAQTFYDGAIISGADLKGEGDLPEGSGLNGSSEALKLTMSPLTLEDRTRIWAAVNRTYHLSLTYEVRVVNLAPTPGDPVQIVSSREIESGVLEPQP